jgi:hypothetical protein
MKKFGRAGSTFGTVIIAVIVLALAGTTGAVAGGLITSAKIKNNTIKSIDVRNNNLRGVDIRDGSLTSADLAAGTVPAVPKVRWALVNNTHTAILAQSGGISIANTGTGVYLNMGSSVAGSAISVTNAHTDADPAPRGAPYGSICGGGTYGSTCVVPGTNNSNHVWVATTSTANALEDHAFYVTVIG